ncbi:MAG: hypothetical protein ACREBU_02090 [Nitrososphaera sp.]
MQVIQVICSDWTIMELPMPGSDERFVRSRDKQNVRDMVKGLLCVREKYGGAHGGYFGF